MCPGNAGIRCLFADASFVQWHVGWQHGGQLRVSAHSYESGLPKDHTKPSAPSRKTHQPHARRGSNAGQLIPPSNVRERSTSTPARFKPAADEADGRQGCCTRTNPPFWTLAARPKPWAQRETSADNLPRPMLSRCIDRAGAKPWLDGVQLQIREMLHS